MEDNNEYVKEVTLDILKIEVMLNNEEKVQKVIFETDQDQITYKPLTNKKEFINGMEIVRRTLCQLGELPPIITSIGKTIQMKGKAKVIANYVIWHKEDQTYKFVNGTKMLGHWKLVDEEEERVE